MIAIGRCWSDGGQHVCQCAACDQRTNLFDIYGQYSITTEMRNLPADQTQGVPAADPGSKRMMEINALSGAEELDPKNVLGVGEDLLELQR